MDYALDFSPVEVNSTLHNVKTLSRIILGAVPI